MTTRIGQILQELRTWVIVAVITVLIWLYAESNTLLSDQEVKANVQFVAPPGARLFVVPPPNLGPVTIRYRCRSDRQRDLERLVETEPILIEVAEAPGDGEPRQSIRLAERLAAYEKLTKLGVTIEDVSPASMTVDVYQKEELRLPIRMNAEGIEFKSPGAAVTPAEAVIDVPVQAAAALRDAALEVRLERESVANLPENVPQVMPLPIVVPESVRQHVPESLRLLLQPRPLTAEASFALTNRVAEFTHPGLPLQVMMPAEDVARYGFEIDPSYLFYTDVRFSGPQSAIDRLRTTPDSVDLYVKLTKADLEQTRVEKVPILDMPQSVSATPLKAVVVLIKRLEEAPLPEDETAGEQVIIPPTSPASP